MYLTRKHKEYYILDLEADGLQPSKIWVVVLKRLDSGERLYFKCKDDFRNWLEVNPEVIFIGHNAISFDIPVLNRLWDCGISLDRVVDTLVLSYLYRPAMEGGHSLESWGRRLKLLKGDYSDWSRYSWSMLRYCVRDVDLTEKLYLALTKRMLDYGCSELACEIEHRIRVIIDCQQRNGFWFDRERADTFRKELREKQRKIEEDIHKLFPPKRVLVKQDRPIHTKSGSLTSIYQKDRDRYELVHHLDLGTYDAYEEEPFNLGSPKQRVERLLELGWKPEKFTEKGFPKVDEDALGAFSESSRRPEIASLAEWLVIQGRASMLDTWFNTLGSDSRIHGRVNSCGASTRRMTHSSPNCVPTSTKALTRNGWKAWNELIVGEDILAYDMESKSKKWTPLLAVSHFPEAEIYSFGQKHPSKRLYCTSNHSWVVRGRDAKGNDATEKLVEARYLKHNRPIRVNAPFDNDVTKSDFRLLQEKYERDWVSQVCKLSDVELHSIMQGFLLADGCRHGDTWQFAQSEGNLLEAFMLCLYLITDTRTSAVNKTPLAGPNQRMGYNVIQTKNTWMRTKDMSLRFECIGEVWCPTTQYGTWVMKQGDFITITGNTANIPSGAKARYGHECRSFWGVEPNKGLIQVGADASGLENVGLLHYLNNKRATELLTQKKPNDVHSLNARLLTEALGFEVDRDWGAKTTFFALIFGAGDEKLGSIVKKGSEEGAVIRRTIIENVPGFEELLKDVEREFYRNKGRIKTIDGGFVWCPSLNAALNYRVQSLGACVMKLACIILHEDAKKEGLEFQLLATIHDEWQMQTKKENGERLGQLAVQSMTKAAERLKFNVPLFGEYRLGYSWDECH